jgi:hypothetical protein
MNRVPTFADAADWKRIACIGGNDKITEVHITNLLLAHGIQAAIHGSRMYAIEVPSATAADAIQLLRSDTRNRDYHISFESGEVLEAPEPKEVVQGISVLSLLKRADYSSETALGLFLRADRISQLTAKYPYMFSLSLHERRYLATPHAHSTGWDVRFELHTSARGRADGCRGWCQLLDDGRKVHLFGFNEWGSMTKGE